MQSTQWVSLLAYVAGSYFGLFKVRVSQKKRGHTGEKTMGEGARKEKR